MDAAHALSATLLAEARWELYRLLGEPFRIRLLVLASEDELSVGELAELLHESQPNVSKHVAALRRAGLLVDRKQGTRVFVRLAEGAPEDAVVADALRAGRALCEQDGSLARVAEIVRKRDAAARDFFARGGQTEGELEPDALPPELPAYLAALAPLIERRQLAVDAGTGDGRLLDVLAPLFDRVVGLDRSSARLARAAQRVSRRGYVNVELVEGEVDDAAVRRRVRALGGADVVFASRILHHAPKPVKLLEALAALARPAKGDHEGGAVVVLDYQIHEDERLREQQADLWLGFDERELVSMAHDAGLCRASVRGVPSGVRGRGPDAHVGWQVLVARRA
ncbi:metalloregulator ArsR/SmtB family transcription factor [Sandaracinus amylolyticus]|uniref:metalloregulator ArsR/SmtB family transcription factor n=1 Tax=Sandaracinus amylolyticus TaxID=927083 RepID=UPI001F00A3B8|nr:metalloregulator ArsR/SmtB family transcription factor [Sandaracinus amylolyticus]UJR81899.1 Methyltransferase [Sandaracinus amylolyticus]